MCLYDFLKSFTAAAHTTSAETTAFPHKHVA